MSKSDVMSPPITTVAKKALLISRPRRGGQRHRKKPEAGHQCRHQHRPQADDGGLFGRIVRIKPLAAQVLGSAHPDQAVEDGDAKQGDEPHSRRDAEVHVAKCECIDAAGSRHRDGQKNEHGQFE